MIRASRIGGVVLNRVGSDRHRRLVSERDRRLGVPVLGSLPRSEAVKLPERHLGLVQADETSGLDAVLDAMADFVEAHVDIDGVRGIAGRRPRGEAERDASSSAEAPIAIPPPGRRIALARDEAFSFIYPHVLEGWRDSGARSLRFLR